MLFSPPGSGLSRRDFLPAFLAATAILASFAATARAETPDEAYRSLLSAWQEKKYADALEMAERFRADHAGYKFIAAALYLGGNSGLRAGQYGRAEPFYRALLDRHPDYKKAGAARDELVTLLHSARRLADCVKQCEDNLESDPSSAAAVRWRFMKAQSLFRLWKFDEAKEALDRILADHTDTPFGLPARRLRDQIDPEWQVGENGLVGGYSGKFVSDSRFRSAMSRLPSHVEEARSLLFERLGIDMGPKPGVLFRIEDAGDGSSLAAGTDTYGIGGQPVEVVTLRAEFVVICPEDFRLRVIHELKHVGFRAKMGQAYLNLPRWVREGLAVWGSGQLPFREANIISNAVFGGEAPSSALDGIVGQRHELDDYLEDALAFEFLENREKGNVRRFCSRLVAGEDYRAVYADLAGAPFDEALAAADRYCAERIAWVAGQGWADYGKIREAVIEAGRKSGAEAASALDGPVKAGVEKWLSDHPGHVLAPNVRYIFGKALVIAGLHEQGREHLSKVGGLLVCTCGDDALYWTGISHEKAGETEKAARVFGILLRDYSWSKAAEKVRGRYPAAGPEKE